MKKGIDVSDFQGSIDWGKVKAAGIDYAIIKSSLGSDLPSQVDAFFHQNVKACIKNNIAFGTYHFAYFVNEQKAKEEADFACRLAEEYKRYVKFIALDVEGDSERYAKAMGYSPNWTKCCLAFLERVKSKGFTPVLYSNQSWLESKLDKSQFSKYKLWYAAYGADKPKYSCAIWQYGDSGKVSGVNGNVDMNYVYDESIFKSTVQTTVKSPTKPVEQAKTIQISNDLNTFMTIAESYKGRNGNYVCNTKLKLGMIVDWCAYSISAIMKDCGFIGKYQGGIYGYASDAAREDNGKYGEWFKKGTKAPQKGDYIMFRYASFTNPLDKYSASHVGIVKAVNGDKITTLEGNVDGNNSSWAATSTFKEKTRYLSNSDVYAFYRPKWQYTTVTAPKTEAKTNSETTKKKTVEELAKEVINGQWGAGEERKSKLTKAGYNYSAVQSKVNELLKVKNLKSVDVVAKEVIDGKWGNGDERKKKLTAAGYNYTEVQNKVNQLLQPKKTIKKSSIVKVKSGAKSYDGKSLAGFVYSSNFYVMELVGNRAVIGIDGNVTAAVKTSDLILVK